MIWNNHPGLLFLGKIPAVLCSFSIKATEEQPWSSPFSSSHDMCCGCCCDNPARQFVIFLTGNPQGNARLHCHYPGTRLSASNHFPIPSPQQVSFLFMPCGKKEPLLFFRKDETDGADGLKKKKRKSKVAKINSRYCWPLGLSLKSEKVWVLQQMHYSILK